MLCRACLYISDKHCVILVWERDYNVTAMNRSRSLPSDPEFLLQFMEVIDSDCSDDDFDGYVDEVTETLL